MHYSESREFDKRPRGVWILRLPTGLVKLLVCAAEMSYLEVHDYCKVHHKEFSLGQLDVGEMTILLEGGEYMYSTDSRFYDQNLNSVNHA